MKSKKIIRRFYCGGGNKQQLETKKVIPIVDELSTKGIFNDSEHRKHLLEYWKQSKERQKTITIKGNKIIENEPIIIKSTENKVVIENKKPEKVYSRDNKGNVVKFKKDKEEEKEEQQKELPYLAQMMIKKGIEKHMEKVEKTQEKTQIKRQEKKQGNKEFLISTILNVANLVYNSQGSLAIVAGLYKYWEMSSDLQKELAIGVGIKSVLYVVRKPWNIFCRWIGKYKWRISSGSFGSGVGYDLIQHLNEKGATIIPLYEGKKNYIINNNIKEIIQQEVLKAENNGIIVTDNMVEQMVLQGNGVLISKNSLEPMIKDLPYETKMDIYELDIFSSEIATKHINYENIPSMVENPINAAQNVINYTDNIITTFNAGEGSIGGGFSFTNLLVGIVIMGGFIYGGIQLNNYFKSTKSSDLLGIENNNGNSQGIFEDLNKIKNWIWTILIGGGFLGNFFRKEEKALEKGKEANKEDDDNDLC